MLYSASSLSTIELLLQGSTVEPKAILNAVNYQWYSLFIPVGLSTTGPRKKKTKKSKLPIHRLLEHSDFLCSSAQFSLLCNHHVATDNIQWGADGRSIVIDAMIQELTSETPMKNQTSISMAYINRHEPQNLHHLPSSSRASDCRQVDKGVTWIRHSWETKQRESRRWRWF
jgi:hypothetical protein